MMALVAAAFVTVLLAEVIFVIALCRSAAHAGLGSSMRTRDETGAQVSPRETPLRPASPNRFPPREVGRSGG